MKVELAIIAMILISNGLYIMRLWKEVKMLQWQRSEAQNSASHWSRLVVAWHTKAARLGRENRALKVELQNLVATRRRYEATINAQGRHIASLKEKLKDQN